MSEAQNLRELTPLFYELDKQIPNLNKKMINAAVSVRIRSGAVEEYPAYKENAIDPALSKSLLLRKFFVDLNSVVLWPKKYLMQKLSKNKEYGLEAEKIEMIVSNETKGLVEKKSFMDKFLASVNIKKAPIKHQWTATQDTMKQDDIASLAKLVKSTYSQPNSGLQCSKLFQ